MNLPVPVAMGIWILFGALLLLIMVVGYRHRRAEGYRTVPRLATVPERLGALGDLQYGPLDAVYVCSTRSGDWLARVATPELGVRSRAVVSVFREGVLIDRDGPSPLVIPARSVRGSSTTSGMAGKVVGHDGLDVVTWESPDGVLLDTGLRLAHRGERPGLRAAVTALVSPP